MKTTTQTPVITNEMIAAFNRMLNSASPEPEENLDGDIVWNTSFVEEDYNVLTELGAIIKRLSKKTK